MLIPFALILFIFLIRFTIIKAKLKVDVNKHVLIRLFVLAVSMGLIYLLCYITEGRNGMLGALYFSAYFIGAWILYLIVEAISLLVAKQNKLGRTNLLILSFVAFLGAMVVGLLANT